MFNYFGLFMFPKLLSRETWGWQNQLIRIRKTDQPPPLHTKICQCLRKYFFKDFFINFYRFSLKNYISTFMIANKILLSSVNKTKQHNLKHRWEMIRKQSIWKKCFRILDFFVCGGGVVTVSFIIHEKISGKCI